jgi:hypothetical protein
MWPSDLNLVDPILVAAREVGMMGQTLMARILVISRRGFLRGIMAMVIIMGL